MDELFRLLPPMTMADIGALTCACVGKNRHLLGKTVAQFFQLDRRKKKQSKELMPILTHFSAGLTAVQLIILRIKGSSPSR